MKNIVAKKIEMLMNVADLVTSHRRACAHWEGLVSCCEAAFGTDGSLISGGFRPDWPESAKAQCREAARAVTEASNAAYAAWIGAGMAGHTYRDVARHRAEVRASGVTNDLVALLILVMYNEAAEVRAALKRVCLWLDIGAFVDAGGRIRRRYPATDVATLRAAAEVRQ